MKKGSCNTADSNRFRCNIRVVVQDQDWPEVNTGQHNELIQQNSNPLANDLRSTYETIFHSTHVVQHVTGHFSHDAKSPTREDADDCDAFSLNVINANRKYKFGSLLDLSQLDREFHREVTDGRLRRVVTAQARRKKRNQLPGFTLTNAVMKEPLRVVHSVPLNFQCFSLQSVLLAVVGKTGSGKSFVIGKSIVPTLNFTPNKKPIYKMAWLTNNFRDKTNFLNNRRLLRLNQDMAVPTSAKSSTYGPGIQIVNGIPKRDRSKSLVVDRVTPLICVDSQFLEDPKVTLLKRRRSSSSSSTDLGCRRGVFSRRHYGSVELLAHVECEGLEQQMRRFRVECGEHVDKDEIYSSPSTPVLENPEYQTRWYFKYFLGRVHQNYVGADSDKVPFFLSVALIDSNNQCYPQYRAILWKRTGAQKICISHSPNKPMTVKSILSNFSSMDKFEKGPKEIFAPEIQKDLLLLEEQEGSVNFKFGVLLAKAGQTTDDEMYSNENGSKDFDRFIALLGDKVRLKGWDKYRGGLDVKGDMTGKHSVYTIYEGHEIMFHVSTHLPYSKDNKQQVERKRHIGNDIVNIIFVEGTSEDVIHFKPTMIKSQFTHIFAVVSYNSTEDIYRLSLFSEETVPLFGPSLPCPNIFHNSQEFREFLLVKLINGEKAAFNTPIFSQKRERTLDMLIKDLFTEHMSENRSTMLNRRAFSDVFPDPPRGNRRKEEARQVEFVRFGQALKLDTIVKGDAPTSLATTSLYKREPWEPQCFYPDFTYDLICGDSWGDNRLILATESGIFDVEEGMSHRLIFDKTVQVKQINVIEAHGILLFRTDKGRDSKVHVFRLSDFDDNICNFARNKCDLKDHKLERTKGCHLYAVSRAGGSHLRVGVAVGKKLLIMQWRHSAAWTAWCPSSDTDTVDGFQYIKEISLSEPPVLLTLIDSSVMSEDNQISVGYKHQFDLVNEKTGEVIKLHQVEGSKVHLVAATDIYEDEEAELLLCYNHTSHFQKLNEETSTEFDFQWTAVPEAIVCAFPYILAFTSDTIEIRLIINGNLIQTMVMPNLSLVTSKTDIYFSTTAPEFFQVRNDWVKVDKLERDPSLSPPSSPHSTNGDGKPLRIYRIPLSNLTGGNLSIERRVPSPCTPTPKSHCCSSLLEIENNERCCNSVTGTSRTDNCMPKEMHLRVNDQPERGSRSGPTTPVLLQCPPKRGGLCKERNHSASSDSGIGKSLGCSPPPSPQIFSDNSDDYTNDGFSNLDRGSKT